MAYPRSTKMEPQCDQSYTQERHSKYIANIPKPYGKLKEQHIHSSKSFSAFICQQKIEHDEIMVSFHITSLYTTIPIDQALLIIRDLLEHEEKLADRTLLSPRQILDLLDILYAPHTSNSMEISTNKQTEQQWEVQLQPLFQKSICNH